MIHIAIRTVGIPTPVSQAITFSSGKNRLTPGPMLQHVIMLFHRFCQIRVYYRRKDKIVVGQAGNCMCVKHNSHFSEIDIQNGMVTFPFWNSRYFVNKINCTRKRFQSERIRIFRLLLLHFKCIYCVKILFILSYIDVLQFKKYLLMCIFTIQYQDSSVLFSFLRKEFLRIRQIVLSGNWSLRLNLLLNTLQIWY